MNLTICISSMILSVVSILLIQINRRIDRQGSRYLTSLGVLNFLFAAAYLTELLMTRQADYLYTNIMWWAVALEYVVPFILSLVMTEYLFHRIEGSDGIIRMKWIPRFIYAAVLALTCYYIGMGRFYGVSAMGVYYRGDMYVLSQVIGILLVLMNLIILFVSPSNLTGKEKNALIAYFLAPVCSVIIQLFGTQLYVMVVAMTVSMLMIAIYLQHFQSELYYSREKDLAELKMVLLLSQLRPHFLYNALSSISQLCKKNPEQASEMTDRFAEYLRKNMRDIKNNEPVPFETELEHIKNYIAIEQMRYSDLIKTEYDIQVKDFEIPAFVLQPLVENAIRHGLYKKEEGGTIRISTRISGKMIILTLADDGVGFDTRQKKDKEPHLGIESVRKRVETLPHANFMMSSIPGMGTTAVIMLPYQKRVSEPLVTEAETAQTERAVQNEPATNQIPAEDFSHHAQVVFMQEARKELKERETEVSELPEKLETVDKEMEEAKEPAAELMTPEQKVKSEIAALEAILDGRHAM